MANFRPKRSIMDPLLPKGVHYEDTLERFLGVKVEKTGEGVDEPPTQEEKEECTT